MTDWTDRIAEVLRGHEWSPDEPFQGLGQCECDHQSCIGWATWAAHVAEQIEAALGLTEETTKFGGPGEWTPYHRWVSTWTEDTPNVAHDALQPQETASQHQREESE